MRSIVISSLIILTQIFTQGCQKSHVLSEDQKILFQYSYVNNSQVINQGIIIDNEGNILVFNHPGRWNLPDKDGKLSREQVSENLSSCTPTGRKIPLSELQKYSSYILNLASSKVSAIKAKGNGKGTFNYYCFSFSVENAMYRQVTVKTIGDSECENLNFFTHRVVEWMNQNMQGIPVQHQ